MKKVLITGVSSGIGYDAVRNLIEKGCYVFGTVRKEADKQKLESEFPKRFACLLMDVTRVDEIEKAFEQVKSILSGGHLAGLVNNAGYSRIGPMSLMPDAVLRDQLEANFFGVRNVTNTFLPLLGGYKNFKGTPGKIINISSLAGIFNTPFNGAYCISKHALESLSEIYRRELMIYGIDVISIQAGPVSSRIWEKNFGLAEEYFNTDYGPIIKGAEAILRESDSDALPVSVMSDLIYKILKSKNPRAYYIVSKNKLLAWIFVKILPPRFVDCIFQKKLLFGDFQVK